VHILLIIIAIGILIYVWQSNSKPKQDQNRLKFDSINNNDDFDHRVAFVSRGNLFIRDSNQTINQVQSPYIQEMMDRVEKNQQRHGWKQGTSFGTSFVGKVEQPAADQVQIKVTSATFIEQDKVLYFLKDKSFGGLFENDLKTNEEKRLLHKQNLVYQDLRLDSEQKQVLCSQVETTGVANIVSFEKDGLGYRELTGGDTLDSAPCWLASDNQQIVFQSQGIARSSEGFVVAYGPASIQLLDIQQSDLSPVLESPSFDFMSPRVDSRGNLYFIRRPYEAPKYSTSSAVGDFFLFPFRLLRAVFHYLNFFSLMYSRKPLTSASGPEVQADLKDILIKGKRIDTENALKKEKTVNGVPSLVPESWQLVKKESNGDETVLATNVTSFDLIEDKLVYSNGYGVFLLDTEKQHMSVLFKEKLIGEIITS